VVLLCMLFTYRGIKIVLGLRDRFKKGVGIGNRNDDWASDFYYHRRSNKAYSPDRNNPSFYKLRGSSLVASFIALGILQAVSNPRFDRIGGEADG